MPELQQPPPPPPPSEPPQEQTETPQQPPQQQNQTKKTKTKEKKPKTKEDKTPKKSPLKIKTFNPHPKRQNQKKYLISALCILSFCTILTLFIIRLLIVLTFDVLEIAGLSASAIPLAAYFFFTRKHQVNDNGSEEKQEVTSLLKLKLNSDYTLINNLYFGDGDTDINHVLLAPNGVFVLEPRNWSGKITCNGDKWKTPNNPDLESPSRQVRKNAEKIKHILDLPTQLRVLDVWVEGIVVFVNSHAELILKKPNMPAVKLAELPDFIVNYENGKTYSNQQLEEIETELLNKNVKRVLQRNFQPILPSQQN
jgi:hypothetical protein